MTYCYDNLWKILIDHKMTKTQMRQQTGISTNMLAKLGKNEPVSMKTLAKICSLLECGLDDIVQIISDDEQICGDNAAEYYSISNATIRNWKKLKTQLPGRLETRANKRASKRRVLPLEYFCNKDNIAFVQQLLNTVDEQEYDISSVILSLGINLLIRRNIIQKSHVQNVLSEYSNIAVIGDLIKVNLPDDEYDIIGLIYQCYLQEGKKNVAGSYYTPKYIVDNMISEFDFSRGQKFLDPCCGSGAFLLSLNSLNPNQIYGVDNDKTAVLVAKINLLLKYANSSFIPQIYCLDYLQGETLLQQHDIFAEKFDYIATNPPWGAQSVQNADIPEICSKETFSYFFVRAFGQLKKDGHIRFLFPKSILNVKVHKDIRQFILEKTKLIGISIYDELFSGVTTSYIDMECGYGTSENNFLVNSNNNSRYVDIKAVYETDNLVFNLLNDYDISIIKIIKERGMYSLKNSTWALGIVTGDNKRKLFHSKQMGSEEIYTGKEIQPYLLKPARNYIIYDRGRLQQVAKDEIYRASEKLVYKFISNRLVFAYDSTKSLFLNSANILIPDIPNMSVKTVLAFLNSQLFQYLYIKLFGEVKILKGNLIELPFPEITEKENCALAQLVDDILNGDNSKREMVDQCIFSLYGLSMEEIFYVRRIVNGTID